MALYNLRAANVGDIEALLQIEQACFSSDRLSRRQFSYLLTRAKAQTWVLISKGVISAYCMLLLPVITRPARLYSLAVLPEYQGRGMAQYLIRDALDEVALHGYKNCVLEVRVSARSTIRLYENNGFSVRKKLEAYYEDGEDGFRMSRTFKKKSPQGKKYYELV